MAIILSLNCPQCGNADDVCPSTFLAEGSCFCVRCGLWFTPLQAGHWEVCGKEKVWVTSSVQPKTEGAKFEGPAAKERQDIEDAGKRIKEIIVNGIKQAKDAPLPSAQEIEDARNSWLGDTEAIRHRRLEQLGNQNSAKVVGIDSTLVERRKIHGDFSEHARIAQNLKSVMRNSLNWRGLSDRQHEALEMLAHKIGRVLAGDPNHPDHWHDIQGYARLIERYLTNEDAA